MARGFKKIRRMNNVAKWNLYIVVGCMVIVLLVLGIRHMHEKGWLTSAPETNSYKNTKFMKRPGSGR